VNDPDAVVALHGATLRIGGRTLWEGVDLRVGAGEFLAVLGPNGAGKTSLLRVLLGLRRPTAGQVKVLGSAPRRGDPRIGFVPQQHAFDRELPLRGRDLVGMGLDGHLWGFGRMRGRRAKVGAAIAAVHAGGFADAPVGLLSGGEQQRLRVAQALVSDPAVMLCDEPLLSLDLSHQRTVVELLDERRRTRRTVVVFVTHEINPVLRFVDRILYLASGSWAAGTPDEVLTSATLSHLYRTTVDVLRVRGRIVVVGAPEDHAHDREPDGPLG
jgi:zinc/manganese transport system ATP-binding protein